MTPEKLVAATGCGAGAASAWAGPLSDACTQFDITTKNEVAMFVAQCAHESGLFTRFRENLNYSDMALLQLWPSHFSAAQAERCGRTPNHAADQPMIANLAYANRMGNGDVDSGDGWMFRGAGPIQITGRDMFARCGAALGLGLVDDPELLVQPYAGARSAAWLFAVEKGLLPFADRGDVGNVTKRINGGAIGLLARVQLFTRCQGAL